MYFRIHTMYFFVNNVFLAALLLIGSFSYSNAVSLRIDGGTIAGEFDAPFMVAVINKPTDQIVCGGSIISKRTIITVAYFCLEKFINDTRNASILFGSTDIKNPNAPRVNLTAVLIHPNFDKLYNNLALGIVEQDFVFSIRVQSIPIERTLIGGEVEGTIYGWGRRQLGNYWLRDLHKLNVITIQQFDCERLLEGYIMLKDYHICTMAKYGEACGYDLGSPLVWNGKIIAVLTYTFGYCGFRLPHPFNRISHFGDWIEANIKH